LLAWAVQSVLSCVGRRAIHIPQQERLPAVRAALHAVAAARLVPLGEPRRPAPPRLQPVSMRERLLLAAFEQFGDNGYQDTSMASIGAAADVTGASLYSYFESKADLLRALYDRGNHALWVALDAAMSRTTEPAEALRFAVESYIRLARTWASTIEDPTGELALDESALAAQREYVGEWVALLSGVMPRLSRTEARLRVHIALFLVSDLYRNPRVSCYEGFQENLALTVLAVLLDGRVPSRG
jgi:AcrR family transcriptional regulator